MFSKISYFKKQLWLVIGVNTLSLAFASVFLFGSFVEDYRDNLVDVTQSKLSMLSSSTASALLFNDQAAAKTVLESLIHSPGTRFAMLLDQELNTFATYSRNDQTIDVELSSISEGGEFINDNLYLFEPVRIDSELIGYIVLSVDTISLQQQKTRYAKIFFVVFVVSLLIAYALNWRLQRILTAPINSIIELVTYVSNKREYQRRLTGGQHQDEIGQLTDGINSMLDTIEQRETQLKENSERLESLVALRTEQLFQRANYDALTDLPNRHLLIDRLDHGIDNALRENLKIALMFLDLDRFKVINDSLGHTVGDMLLKQVAERLAMVIENSDSVCRWGGDEFVILMEHVEQKADVEGKALEVINTLSKPFDINGHHLHISTSIGIAIFPRDGIDSVTLLKHADISMYHAKERGPGKYSFFTGDMLDESLNRLSLERDLRLAVEKNAFELVYQPQICLAAQKICGFEALIRWNNNDTYVSPAEFLPVAEEIGLLNEISEWVVKTACLQNAHWVDQGLCSVPVAVNLPASFIVQPSCAQFIQTVLSETGLDPRLLEVEITENAFVASTDLTLKTLESMKTLGIGIAIDDFGTGYSCMSYLRDLPVSKLKIDGSFVSKLGESDANDGIVKSIITLGKSLQLSVVGECVETHKQMQMLLDMDCDMGQGYLHSRPLAVKDVPNYIGKTAP